VLGLVVSCGLVLGLLLAPASSAVGPTEPPAATRPALQDLGTVLAPVVAAPAQVADAVASLAAPTASRDGATVLRKLVRRLLSAVNVARAVPQRCGKKLLPAVGPVTLNRRLNRAAQKYARKMARHDWFDHEAPGGAGPGERISAAGYRWSRWGENIAAGYDGVLETVAAWLDSPGHCRTLMGSYRHVGLGYAYDAGSTYGHYWVQDFATPR
jgi:uncharacterized protein YkwD